MDETLGERYFERHDFIEPADVSKGGSMHGVHELRFDLARLDGPVVDIVAKQPLDDSRWSLDDGKNLHPFDKQRRLGPDGNFLARIKVGHAPFLYVWTTQINLCIRTALSDGQEDAK